jgi:PhnB protein
MTDADTRTESLPHLTVHAIVADANRAASWYCEVLGAEERTRIVLPDGRLIDVQLLLGSSMLVLADEFPEHGVVAPTVPSVVLYLHVDDVDAVWARALEAGAEIARPLEDMVWGEREGQLIDPFGHKWGLTQHVRDVPHEEKSRAVAEMLGM